MKDKKLSKKFNLVQPQNWKKKNKQKNIYRYVKTFNS